MTLPAAFAALGAYRRFVTYALEPDQDRPGKTIKRPTDVQTGRYCKAINPAHQYSYAEAAATGRPVGFVFDRADGFWFLDMDGALEANPAGGYQWNALATELCGQLSGAAVEVSQSKTGLHLIGRGTVPDHACRNIPAHLELYTHDRFVALTFDQAGGDVNFDAAAPIQAIAARFFPPNPHGEIAGWTAEPVPEWGGPADDIELLRAAIASGKKSGAAAFGNAVTFEDLWTANEDALSRKWPSDKGGYDASMADAALASHLAYWTGKNCERTRDLMLQSQLARQKWEDRPEWLEITIMKAASVVTNVAKGKPALHSPVAFAAVPSPCVGVVFDGDQPSIPPRELVKGMLPAQGVAFVGGQSGAGKTFVVIDLAIALATDGSSQFFGHRVKERVGVVIYAAEGHGTLADRLRVAKEHRGIATTLPIAHFASALNLSDGADVIKFCDKLREIGDEFSVRFGVRLGTVIVDTVAAAFAMENENDNAEAAATIRRLNEIQTATGALIVPVHHYGKSEDTGLRGASAYRAGADVVLSVLAVRDKATGAVSNRRLALAKSRTREEGPISGFDLVSIPIGFDEDNEAYGSVAIEPNGQISAAAQCKREPNSHSNFRAAFATVMEDRGEERQFVGGQPPCRSVMHNEVSAEFVRHRYGDSVNLKQRDAARKASKSALTALASEIRSFTDERGVIWLARVE